MKTKSLYSDKITKVKLFSTLKAEEDELASPTSVGVAPEPSDHPPK